MNTHWKRLLIAWVCIFVPAVLFIPTFFSPLSVRANPPARGGDCFLTWRVTPSGLNFLASTLNDVLAFAPNNVWAVGGASDDEHYHPIVIHFDGTAWSVMSLPATGDEGLLYAIAGTVNDLWAVGNFVQEGASKSLTLHWDGVAWSLVPSPNLHPQFNSLNAVAMVSPTNVWAIGSVWDPIPYVDHPLVMHWNGKRWNVSSPSTFGKNTSLTALAAIRSDDVWAFGFGHFFRWDGQSWTKIRDGWASAAAFQGANDIWVVGGGTSHWNGRAWKFVPIPSASYWGQSLNDIAMVAPDDIYVVGTRNGYKYLSSEGVGLHWNGKEWMYVPMPWASGNDALKGLSVVSPTELWAVGQSRNGKDNPQALLLHAEPPCVVPTPTPIPPPPTPTPRPPRPPQLLAPKDGATVKKNRPILKWSGVSGAAAYEIELPDHINGGTNLYHVSASQWKTDKLLDGYTYSWRVRSCLIQNNEYNCGKWSEQWQFKIRVE